MLAMSHQCKHIVPIYELIREEDNTLYFVFEYMPDGTLNDFLSRTAQRGEKVEPSTIRSIIFQVLQGLQHIHSRGYMHRDLKPENLLMRGMDCKVADFSLARGAVSAHGGSMTTYVSTRWYRAPEIILCAPTYSIPVDMFAVGCIVAELYRLFPLFPGTGEVDQLQRILKLLGNLEDAEWPEGVHLSRRFGLGAAPLAAPRTRQHHTSSSITPVVHLLLQEAIPSADTTAISLIHNLLQLNPARRLTAKAAMQHKYFAEVAVLAVPVTAAEPAMMQQHLAISSSTPPKKTSIDIDIDQSRTPGLVSISPGFPVNCGHEVRNTIPSREVHRNRPMNQHPPRDNTMDMVGHEKNVCIVDQDHYCFESSPALVQRDMAQFMNSSLPRSLDHHVSYENDPIQSHDTYAFHNSLKSVSPNEPRLGQSSQNIRRIACTPAQAFNVD